MLSSGVRAARLPLDDSSRMTWNQTSSSSSSPAAAFEGKLGQHEDVCLAPFQPPTREPLDGPDGHIMVQLGARGGSPRHVRDNVSAQPPDRQRKKNSGCLGDAQHKAAGPLVPLAPDMLLQPPLELVERRSALEQLGQLQERRNVKRGSERSEAAARLPAAACGPQRRRPSGPHRGRARRPGRPSARTGRGPLCRGRPDWWTGTRGACSQGGPGLPSCAGPP